MHFGVFWVSRVDIKGDKGMNWPLIRAVIRRDLTLVSRNRGVVLPMFLVPLIMLVALPALAAFVPSAVSMPGTSLSDLESFMARMPAGLQRELAGYNEVQRVVVLMLVYFFAPMYLIVPLMVASVIAADSFAGEKERKTLEALLYTPLSQSELLLGKMLSAWLPALAVGWVGFVLYSITANLAAWPVMGRLFFPTLTWCVLAVWVAPAVAGLGLGLSVLVSARVRTFQEAYQLGGVVVLPIVALVAAQAAGVLYFDVWLALALGAVIWGVAGGLLWLGARGFRSEALLTQV